MIKMNKRYYKARETRRSIIMQRKQQLQEQADTGILRRLYGRAVKFFGL